MKTHWSADAPLVSDCLFCNMSRGSIPVTKLYEDDYFFVIEDIRPKAPSHLLAIPHHHIESLFETNQSHEPLLGYMLNTLKKVAIEQNLKGGFRTVINTGALSGQEIFHLHLHVLGGPNRSLAWD